MKYFSGFSLGKEETLFQDYFKESDYTIVGFSYGAQQAFEYVYKSKQHIDKLILLSPAFFQTQKTSFLRTQLHYFETNQEQYIKNFLSHTSFPSSINLSSYLKLGTKEELHALLYYVWEEKKIQEVLDRGISIEVFLGEKDKIVDTQEASMFFKSCTVYIFKKYGHLLRGK